MAHTIMSFPQKYVSVYFKVMWWCVWVFAPSFCWNGAKNFTGFETRTVSEIYSMQFARHEKYVLFCLGYDQVMDSLCLI
jgi:hypothetical protein